MDLRRLCALRHCFVVVLVIALGDLLVRVSATNSPSPVCINLDIVSETKQTSAIPGETVHSMYSFPSPRSILHFSTALFSVQCVEQLATNKNITIYKFP